MNVNYDWEGNVYIYRPTAFENNPALQEVVVLSSPIFHNYYYSIFNIEIKSKLVTNSNFVNDKVIHICDEFWRGVHVN
jgi:hypothetical protein